MKKKLFTEEQIVRMLRQAQAADQTVAQVCKEHGMSEQTRYRCKSKYSRMEVAVCTVQTRLPYGHYRTRLTGVNRLIVGQIESGQIDLYNSCLRSLDVSRKH